MVGGGGNRCGDRTRGNEKYLEIASQCVWDVVVSKG